MNFGQAVSLIDLQARTALKAEAAKLYLSYIWWILEPLLFVAVLYVVFKFLLGRGTDNFVFFLMCGKVPYLWLSKSITVASNSLLQNRGLIASINIPKIIFPYISIQEVLYKQWVVFVVLFLMALFFDYSPGQIWLWLIPIILTTYIMIVALSLVGAILVTYVQDFRILINLGMLFLMFASGIFWDVNDIQNEFWRDLVFTLNPLAFLIDTYRNVLMYNQPVDGYHLLMVACVFMTVIFFMHLVYKNLNLKLAQQVLQS